MKRIIIIASLLAVCNAYAEQTVMFDFSDTMSLNPSINEPGLKSGVDLDGYKFTEGDVTVEFSASHLGNTSVRLYHSYDAGVDLRLYDGDVMTVTTTADTQYISQLSLRCRSAVRQAAQTTLTSSLRPAHITGLRKSGLRMMVAATRALTWFLPSRAVFPR